MKKKWLYLFMVSILGVTGCGKAKKEAVKDDFSVVSGGSSATQTDVSDSGEIPDHIEFTVVGEHCDDKFTVNADVVADGYDRVDIYKAESAKIDEEYVRKLAGDVFDNGEYEIKQPYFAMTEQQLEGILMEQSDPSEPFYWTYPGAEIERLLNDPTTINPSEFNEGVMFYSGNMIPYYNIYGSGVENFVRMHVDVEEEEEASQSFMGARLSGNIDGKPCEISVKALGHSSSNQIWIYSRDDKIDFAKFYEDYDTYELSEGSENSCNYNDALQTANAVLDKIMPEGDYRLAGSYHRLINRNVAAETYVADGYRFCYTPCVNEATIPMNAYLEFSNAEVFKDGYEWNDFVENPQPMICIDVNADGFLNAKFAQSVIPTEVLATNAKLMSFDQANTALTEELKASVAEKYDDSSLNYEIDKIQFTYLLVSSEDGQAFLPYWIYYDRNRGRETAPRRALYGVNALDGSVCYFGLSSGDFVLIDNVF